MGAQVSKGHDAEPDFAAFVAIDWGNEKHVWVGQAGELGVRERGELEARPEAVEAWITAYLSRFPGRPIAVGLEQKRGALFYMLMKYEQVVLYPIHGASASNFRAALYPSGAKDDPKDADLLLDLLIRHRGHLRRIHPDTPETRKLRLLVEQRRRLVDERTRQSNRLTDQLKLYYPQVLQWFDNLQSPLVAGFLKRWPTLPEAQRARPGTLRAFFHQHNCRNRERMEERVLEISAAVTATTDAAIVEPAVLTVHTLLEIMGCLNQAIQSFEQKIEETMAAHSDAPIFQSLPGAGAAQAPAQLWRRAW